ncbi:thioredoxin domain-containing protein [Carboxylicivirga sp. N1Y90]|uniref:thioredoxin domain-containing protein n=1 Tax=Carboxylicivirga fragile TaxID=3417571 RepID=UPI003D346AEF|nr:thioredoxin fold domain-containing protein [Marinilabiliaceae bacterium N1Y90]
MHISFASIILFLFHQTAITLPVELVQLSSKSFSQYTSNKQVTLIDVRTIGEYKNGHIENSNQLNFYSPNFKRKLLLLPKEEAIFLYCNTGYRSERAAKYLVKNGYSKVYNLEFGIMEWQAQDKPIIIDKDASPDITDKYTPDEFETLIKSHPQVLIDFYAPWCAPCQKMLPLIDSLKTNYHGKINIVKINADASKRLMKKLNIVGVPRLYFYKEGNLQYIHKGASNRKDIETLIRDNF